LALDANVLGHFLEWGFSDAQIPFVSTRLGQAWTADPVEDITVEQMLAYARKQKSKT
jgi:hypothetical protein